jgi:hypothetical protein
MYRYYLWLLAVVGLILILVFLIIPGSTKNKTSNKILFDYASSNATASLTIDGPITANQTHQSIEISVNQYDVTYQQFRGYDGQVVNSQIYGNTENSYNVFLHALYHVGFTKGNTASDERDERGFCPQGDRYILQFSNSDGADERFWSTSCGGLGTYEGSLNTSLILFQTQVPNYSDLIQNVAI